MKKMVLTAMGILGLGLAGCGQSAPTPEAAPETNTVSDAPEQSLMALPSESESESSTGSAEPAAADPERFLLNGNYIFSYEMPDSSTGTCLVTIDGATCTGLAGDEVPNVSIPPFEEQRPGAISVSQAGLHYTIFEGVPPAPDRLNPGELLNIDGVTCEVSENSDITCTAGGNAFTISATNRLITTDGPVTAPYA